MELTVDEEYDDNDEEVELEESDEEETDDSSSSSSSPPQHPRADVLAQYPFKDEHSTVHDVLQHETAYVNLANKFLHEMGPNARKRAAVQVFRDMLEAGKSRMSSVDVEASLNVLGLSRPPIDQQRVERRMQLISESKGNNQSGWTDLGISSDQWLMLVDRCVQIALDKENHFRQALANQQHRILHHRQREAASRDTTHPKPPRAKTFYQKSLSSSAAAGVVPGRSSSSSSRRQGQGLDRPTESRKRYETTPFADDERGN